MYQVASTTVLMALALIRATSSRVNGLCFPCGFVCSIPFSCGKTNCNNLSKSQSEQTSLLNRRWSSFAACLLKPFECSKWERGVNLIDYTEKRSKKMEAGLCSRATRTLSGGEREEVRLCDGSVMLGGLR